MSAARCFFHTNIFLYSLDRSDSRKRAIAGVLIRESLYSGNGIISYQVVQEFVNASLKKFPGAMSVDESLVYLRETFNPMLAVQSSLQLFEKAFAIHTRYKLSWYDSVIVAAAIKANCDVLYTEDLQHGQRSGDLIVTNPFL